MLTRACSHDSRMTFVPERVPFRRRIVLFICLIYSGMIHDMDHMIIKRIVLLNLVSRNEHWTLWDLESLARSHDYNDDQGSDEKMSAFPLLSLKVNQLVTGLVQDHKLIDPPLLNLFTWFPNDFRSRKSSFRRRIVLFICLIYSGMIHDMDHMIIKRIVLLNLFLETSTECYEI